MKTHTSDYKTAIAKPGRQIKNEITYELNGETIVLNDDVLYSVNYNYEGSILKSVMKQLEINCKDDIPLNTILNGQFSLLVNDEWEDINFGNYVVYKSEKQEDTETYKITCYDKMLYSMKDYKSMGITYPITIRDYLSRICNELGLTFKSASDTFANYNKQIQNELYLDSNGNSMGYTFRDVLDELAQATASTICINEDDDGLEVRYINDTNDTIDGDYLKNLNVNFGEYTKPINTILLSRAGGSDKVYKSYPDGLPENQRVAIEIADNQIMNWNDRADYLPGILNKLNGLTYCLNDYESTGITYYNLCDKYNVHIGENDYSCIMFNDEVNITQGLEEKVHTDIIEQSQTDYTKADKTDRRINQTYLIVDKQNQVIESVVSQTVDPDNPESTVNKVSRLTQRVDSLESEIQNVTGMVTTKESTLGMVTFTDETTEGSEPVTIKVNPTNDNISYLYPHSNLFPSSTTYLKTRTLRFHNNNTNENFDYVLPDDLLYYNQDNYDEFYLDYNSQTCQITKKCKYNADGTVSLLSTPTVTPYAYPEIHLTEGSYTVSLLGYSNAYLSITLMAKNIYTDQFYTKAETDSKITQTAESIDLSVNQKLSNYSTTTEMNSVINIKANEITSSVSETYATKTTTNQLSSRISQTAKNITLTVNNGSTSSGLVIGITKEDGTTSQATGTIQMTGLVSFTNLSTSGQTTINGGNITTGTIKSSNYVSGTSGTSINLSNGAIDSKNFKVSSSGNITATGGTIGGWTISNSALYTSSNNYYLGTTGITATIGGTSRSNIILKAGSNFGVNSSGVLYANSAVFSNASVQGSISGSSISGGSISGTSISGSSITGGSININDYFSVNTSGGTQLSTSGGGFLTTRRSTHPYVSALNVAQGSGGIVFTTGSDQSSVGSAKTSIELVSGVMRTRNNDYYSGYYTCRTGKVSVLGNSSQGTFEYYVAIVNGLVVYVGDWNGLQNYSELPWLTTA